MHLIKLLEQMMRSQSPMATDMYEEINGPHFNEEYAYKAVKGMENEDGSKGPHWTVEETTSIANKLGIDLKSDKHNKWDWFVAMNMIYSDFYKAIVTITGSANTKYFAELTKAWLCDKDISKGKMWHYYIYIMCDDKEKYNDYKYREYDDEREDFGRYAMRYGRNEYPKSYGAYSRYASKYDDYDRYYDMNRERMERERMEREMRDKDNKNTSVRYF